MKYCQICKEPIRKLKIEKVSTTKMTILLFHPICFYKEESERWQMKYEKLRVVYEQIKPALKKRNDTMYKYGKQIDNLNRKLQKDSK